MTDSFGDRERGPRPWTKPEIEVLARGGLVALISSYVANGGFGIDFPESCTNGRVPTGAESHKFGLALRAEVPDIDWPLRAETVPHTLNALDLIEFCHSHVVGPVEGNYHRFFSHSHLSF